LLFIVWPKKDLEHTICKPFGGGIVSFFVGGGGNPQKTMPGINTDHCHLLFNGHFPGKSVLADFHLFLSSTSTKESSGTAFNEPNAFFVNPPIWLNYEGNFFRHIKPWDKNNSTLG